MADRKVGEITVPTEPVSRATKITGFTFKSYDKNAGVLQFNIENQDGSPTDLIDATVRLFMYIYQGEEKKEFPIFDNQIITESYMQGIVKYPIPDMLLSYEGKVDANVYIDFPDGSHTDNLAFTFNIEKSVIDDNAQLNGEYYFKDFQQLLDGVKQEATDAVNEVLEHANQKITEYDQKFQQTAQNIATLDQNFTELRNDMKLSEAWAWSKDGTDRFTRKYPGENYAKNSRRTLELSNVTNNINLLKGDVPYNFADLAEKTVTISVEIEVKNAQPQTSGVDFRIGCEASMPRASGGTFYLGVWENLSAGQTIATKRISRTLSIPNDIVATQAAGLHLYVQANGDYFRVSKPKIEIGDTPTIYTPAPSEDYENAYPQYRGLALLPSDLPDDYSWDITPEYTEKGLNNTVSLTEPQSVGGLKNFEDGLQIAGKEVATVPEDTGWVNLTAINGHSWNKQGQIRRIGKLVMFRGSLKGSTLSTQDFCTIPEGFRPSNPTDNYEYQFLLPPQSSNTLDNGGMAYIRPNGVCGLPSFRGTVNLFLAPIQYYID